MTQTDCLELVTTYGEISTLGPSYCYLIGPIRSEWLCDCWSLLFITESFKVAGLHEIHVCRKIGVFILIVWLCFQLPVPVEWSTKMILLLLICSLVSFFFHMTCVGLALSQLYLTHLTMFLIIVWLTHFNRFPDKITTEIMRGKYEDSACINAMDEILFILSIVCLWEMRESLHRPA